MKTPTPGQWFKSSYSGGHSDYLEAAALPEGIALRDSKHPGGPSLAIRTDGWTAFLTALKAGDAHRPA